MGPAEPPGSGTLFGWAELLLMWELGRSFEAARIAVAADDVAVAPARRRPPLTWDERVAERVAEMEAAAMRIREQITAEAAGAPRRPWDTTKG